MPTDREEALGRFAGVDLGNNATLQRMIRQAKEKRDAIIEQCAIEAGHYSVEAAEAVRKLKDI